MLKCLKKMKNIKMTRGFGPRAGTAELTKKVYIPDDRKFQYQQLKPRLLGLIMLSFLKKLKNHIK